MGSSALRAIAGREFLRKFRNHPYVKKLERFMRSTHQKTGLGSDCSSYQQSQRWQREDVAQPCSITGIEGFVLYFTTAKVTEERLA